MVSEMRYYKPFRGTFTLNGKTFSNEVLCLDDKAMWDFLFKENRTAIVDGVEVKDFAYFACSDAQRAVLHRLMPNDTLFWAEKIYLLYNLHEYADGSRSIHFKHDKSGLEGAYVGYLIDTKYADGSEDGTYWNQCAVLPFSEEERSRAEEYLESVLL